MHTHAHTHTYTHTHTHTHTHTRVLKHLKITVVLVIGPVKQTSLPEGGSFLFWTRAKHVMAC